jgi:hypothetical protein
MREYLTVAEIAEMLKPHQQTQAASASVGSGWFAATGSGV